MNINDIVMSITDRIEKYDNKNKKSWNDIFKNEIKNLKQLSLGEQNLILIKVVREITRRGYSIEDNPFRLVKF